MGRTRSGRAPAWLAEPGERSSSGTGGRRLATYSGIFALPGA